MLSNPAREPVYKQYDTAFKIWIAYSDDPSLARKHNVSPSTKAHWRKTNFSRYITCPKGDAPFYEVELLKHFINDAFGRRLYSVYRSISDVYRSILELNPDWKTAFNSSKNIILDAINKAKHVIGTKYALGLFRISRKKYDSWLKNTSCPASVSGTCLYQYPNQTPIAAIENLKRLFARLTTLHWPLNSIYYQALRDKLFSFSLTTFYKYVKKLKLAVNLIRIKKIRYPTGLRADAINKTWHADVTVIKTIQNVKIYVHLVIDNFSRYVLAWRASYHMEYKDRFDTLIEAVSKCSTKRPGQAIDLIVDGGPENKPIPVPLVLDEVNINKIIAQHDIQLSNSMAESANKQLKYGFLRRFPPPENIEQFNQLMYNAVNEFNNIRPFSPIFGFTPNEVYNQGFIPDKYYFLNQIADKPKPYCPICDDDADKQTLTIKKESIQQN